MTSQHHVMAAVGDEGSRAWDPSVRRSARGRGASPGRHGPCRLATGRWPVTDQVETGDGLNFEGGLSSEGVSAGAYYSHGSGYGQ